MRELELEEEVSKWRRRVVVRDSMRASMSGWETKGRVRSRSSWVEG